CRRPDQRYAGLAGWCRPGQPATDTGRVDCGLCQRARGHLADELQLPAEHHDQPVDQVRCDQLAAGYSLWDGALRSERYLVPDHLWHAAQWAGPGWWCLVWGRWSHNDLPGTDSVPDGYAAADQYQGA